MPSKKWKFETRELNRLREELRHEIRTQMLEVEESLTEKIRAIQNSPNVWGINGAPVFLPNSQYGPMQGSTRVGLPQMGATSGASQLQPPSRFAQIPLEETSFVEKSSSAASSNGVNKKMLMDLLASIQSASSPGNVVQDGTNENHHTSSHDATSPHTDLNALFADSAIGGIIDRHQNKINFENTSEVEETNQQEKNRQKLTQPMKEKTYRVLPSKGRTAIDVIMEAGIEHADEFKKDSAEELNDEMSVSKNLRNTSFSKENVADGDKEMASTISNERDSPLKQLRGRNRF